MSEKPQTQVASVKMDDGTVVDFAGKKKMLKSSTIDADGGVTIRLDFRNGEVRTFKCPESLLRKAAAHGLEQKFGDEIAGLKKDNGEEADIEDHVLAIDELAERLGSGEWNARRESNGMAGTSVLLRALCELRSLPVETVKTFLRSKTHAEKVALREHPDLKPIIQRLEAEKASKSSKSVDTNALLAELA